MPITPADTPIQRDRWGRPLIIPPDGGKPVPYTRATTLAGTCDDLYGLMAWKQRQTALGLADRPDLQVAVVAHRDDKKQLDRICEQALEASGSSAAATTGTALHKLTELVDAGHDLPVMADQTAADLDAYRAAVAPFRMAAVETLTVNDDLQVAGTPDRIVEWAGQRFIFDLKTGQHIDYGIHKIACQLAIYANSAGYDAESGTRFDLNVNRRAGIVCHLPAGGGTARLLWVDLVRGWEAVQLAVAVRAWRKTTGLTVPFHPSDVQSVA